MKRAYLLFACVVALMSLGIGSPAYAEEPAIGPQSALTEARVALEDQRYEKALALVTPLLSVQAPSRARASALEIGAVSYLLLDRRAEAKPLIHDLYDLAPAFELNDRSLPPRVTLAFDEEAAKPHARAVALAVRPLRSDAADYEVTQNKPSARMEMICNSGLNASPTRVALSPHGAGTLHFKLPTLGTYKCYGVALDADDIPLGRIGSRASPVTLHALEKEKPGIASKWWFWTGIGVVVAGAAAGTYFAVRSSETTSPPSATLTISPQSFRP